MAEQVYNNGKEEMLLLTGSSVYKLSNIWSRIFDQTTCSNNLRQLVEHTNNFFSDLRSESLQKESLVKEEIEKLRSEAEDLQRLLKTDVKLPNVISGGNVPLSVVLSEMNKTLSNPREELDRRIEEICDLLFEQDPICDELGEPARALIDDPLPTAEEVDDFREYLKDLKKELVKRKQELRTLRKEIKKYLHILEPEGKSDADDRLVYRRDIKLNNETFERLNKMRDSLKEQVEKLKKKNQKDKATQSNGSNRSHMCCSSGVPPTQRDVCTGTHCKTPCSTKPASSKHLSFGSDAEKLMLHSKDKATPKPNPGDVSVKPTGTAGSAVESKESQGVPKKAGCVFSTPTLPVQLSGPFADTSSVNEFVPTADKKFKHM